MTDIVKNSFNYIGLSGQFLFYFSKNIYDKGTLI